MDETFKQAKESPPRNFPRDIKNAIKSGWIHAETPRTYAVTRSGWNRIGQATENLEQCSAKPQSNYRVLPLPVVQRDAKKLLTAQQLREGIGLAKRLRHYPTVPDLSIERCGEGMELHLESPVINPQGWLRAIFWVHEKSRTIYIVDLFWKKTNKVTITDLHRANHRIRQLKAGLA